MFPFFVLIIIFAQAGEVSFSNEDCLDCHETTLSGSVHEDLNCVECHQNIADLPHDTPLPKVNCGSCHEDIEKFYKYDPHGRLRKSGNLKAPTCTNCHGTHSILPVDAKGSPLSPSVRNAFCVKCHNQIEAPAQYHTPSYPPNSCLSCHGTRGKTSTFVDISVLRGSPHKNLFCTDCHRNVKRLQHKFPEDIEMMTGRDCGICHKQPYLEHQRSIHGRALKAGIKEAAHCWDCHGTHDIIPPNNTKSHVFPLNLPATCGKCHGDPKLAEKFKIPVQNPYQMYIQGIHFQALKENLPAATCSDCHGVHNILELSDPSSPINKSNVSKTCSKCHQQAYEDYSQSIHAVALGKGVLDAPSCADCHAEHRILPPDNPESPVYPFNVPKTCGSCHENYVLSEKYGIPGLRLSSYFESFHGVALQGGKITAANCTSCHENHRILPSSDPESPINIANLDQTCGQCHLGIRVHPEEFTVHQVVGTFSDWISGIVRTIYLWIIGITIGGMLFYVFADWLYKVRYPEAHKLIPENPHKFNKTERSLHLIHLVSFFVLAYTGFAHRYPDTIFTTWLSSLMDGTVRAYLHRIAGVVLIAVFLLQGYLAIFTSRGRSQIRGLLLRWNDIKEAFGILARNLGIRETAPAPIGFTFYEKLEYWAFIWGSGIMAITGILLWFTTQTLSIFPKWVLDVSAVIHFYEAILATLAILVWHLYWVIFDPDVYPLNWSMFRKETPPSKTKETSATPV